MTCVNCPPQIETYGADPANIQWTVVRGDTASIRVEFWEDDETTPLDIDGWTFASTAYNPVNDTNYELWAYATANYVDIVALPEQTDDWGVGAGSVVAELNFDLQVTKPDTSVWTPVLGTICVLGDITGGSL